MKTQKERKKEQDKENQNEDGGVDSERTYMKQVVQKYCGTVEEDIFNADEVEAQEELDQNS